jgi:hypothetical protein
MQKSRKSGMVSMREIDILEVAMREEYARTSSLTIDRIYGLSRFTTENTRNIIIKLASLGSIKIIDRKVMPNMGKRAFVDDEKKLYCVKRLKETGKEITPSNILNLFQVLFGLVDNAESFLRYCRFDRDIIEKVPAVEPQRKLTDILFI